MVRVMWNKICKVSNSVFHIDVTPSPSPTYFPSLTPKLCLQWQDTKVQWRNPFKSIKFLIYQQLGTSCSDWHLHCALLTLAKTKVIQHDLTVIMHHPECVSVVRLLLHFEWTPSESPFIPAQQTLLVCTEFLESNWLHFPFWL